MTTSNVALKPKTMAVRVRNIFLEKFFLDALFPRNEGAFVMKESWQNLIILDACRFDAFAEYILESRYKGQLEWRVSRGSTTRSFLLENFQHGHFNDVVYVTANPHVNRFLRNNFYRIVSVWKDGWDSDNQTVLPQTMVDFALDAIRRNPGKRLIVHFMQPHHPYIGFKPPLKNLGEPPLLVYTPQWNKWYDFMISHPIGELKRLYKRNLALAMASVKRLVEYLPRGCVVTADHGEAFGERMHPLLPIPVYEHPPGVRIQALVKVPWFIPETNGSAVPQPVVNPGSESPEEDEGIIGERLRALGYV